MKYLVTDDSRMGRKMMIKSLKDLIKEEDEIIEASNGEEAIAQYKEHNPTICFMDLTMPVMDGFEATHGIYQYDNNAKIIIVSADIQETSKSKAKESGALGFINKPINQTNLSKMLSGLGLI
jgi:CheY-like chemotaxis protein